MKSSKLYKGVRESLIKHAWWARRMERAWAEENASRAYWRGVKHGTLGSWRMAKTHFRHAKPSP